MSIDSGLTTIEDAREELEDFYSEAPLMEKIKLKCWINHSESRHRNKNQPFTFTNYTNHMRYQDYVEQIRLDMINCDDLGGKDAAIAAIAKKMNIGG